MLILWDTDVPLSCAKAINIKTKVYINSKLSYILKDRKEEMKDECMRIHKIPLLL